MVTMENGIYVNGDLLDVQEFDSKKGDRYVRLRVLSGLDVSNVLVPKEEIKTDLKLLEKIMIKCNVSIYKGQISYFGVRVV